MNVVLWDTRRNHAQKDFAGGMGVGMPSGAGGLRGKIVRHLYLRDYRPTPLNFAYLVAVVKKLGHTPIYVLDENPPTADVYIFNPSLLTLEIELETMRRLRSQNPSAKMLIVGQVAFALHEALAETTQDLQITIVKGEPEQLLYRWDEVLNSTEAVVDVGSVQDLDALPIPDWSQFAYSRFRINYDFWRFPSTFIQQSRGCTFKCNYCPYIIVESKTRFRDPEAVVDEMRFGIERYGFESFKFRDPLFGLNRKKALALAEGIRRLPRRVQFSVETRVDLMREETLVALRDAGLTSITIGIETPDEETLKKYSRVAINDDRQRDFVDALSPAGNSHGRRIHGRLPGGYEAEHLECAELCTSSESDLCELQYRHALPRDWFLRRSQIRDRRPRFQQIQRLSTGHEVPEPERC